MRAVIRPVFALSIMAALAATASAQAQARSQAQPPTQTQRLPVPAPGPAAPAANGGTTVNPVTVEPQTTPQGRVVSSTDAAPITSPDYTDGDAQNPPQAVGLGGPAALGVQAPARANPPPAGLPASMQQGDPKRTDIGVTTVF